ASGPCPAAVGRSALGESRGLDSRPRTATLVRAAGVRGVKTGLFSAIEARCPVAPGMSLGAPVISHLPPALRSLLRHPGFLAAAVGTLALGIGANAVMFTAVSAVLLRPLPYPHPEQLVKLSEMWRGAPNAIAPPNFLDWQRRSHSFDAMAAFVPDAM